MQSANRPVAARAAGLHRPRRRGFALRISPFLRGDGGPRVHHLAALLAAALLLVACSPAQPPALAEGDPLTVDGFLTRVAGIGGESTGWGLVLDTPLVIAGETINLLEINPNPERWPQFEEHNVRASGRLAFRAGIERGRWPVLQVERMEKR